MIITFKIFEENSIKNTFIINDIIDYFTVKNESDIRDFISKNLFNTKNIVEFDCEKCTFNDENGATNYINYNKHHKGKIRGLSYGLDEDKHRIHLTLSLYRIKYDHEVETDSPFTIYGEISKNMKFIIDEVNLKRVLNKYNL